MQTRQLVTLVHTLIGFRKVRLNRMCVALQLACSGLPYHNAGAAHSCIHCLVHCIRLTQKQVDYVIYSDEDDCVEALKMP